MLHVRIEEGRGLLAADSNGFSDPYVKFVVNKKKYKTNVIQRTLHPKWGKTFPVPCTESELSKNGSIVFQVMDEDKVGSNDFLGQCQVDLSPVLRDSIGGWYGLTDKDSRPDPKLGQIRLKINYVRGGDTSYQSKTESMLKFAAMDAQELKVIEEKKLRLECFVGTWNVGNAAPPADLSPWIPKDRYEVYAIGAQECKYSARSGYSSCEEDWFSTLTKHFGDKYVLLKSKSLGQMRLGVYCRASIRDRFMNVEVATEATGIGHVMSNKGGIAIGFSYLDTQVAFVSCHLAAHQHKSQRRNGDVREIINGISRSMGHYRADMVCLYDHVVFMGDLNYRLDYGDQGEEKKPTREQFDRMVSLIDQKKFDVLFSCDQLTHEMKKGSVFAGFQEGRYNFAPTFKVLRNETLAYTEQRSPSWCDRILWHSLTKEWIDQKGLGSSNDITTSDHKPVWSHLSMPIFQLPSFSATDVSSCKIFFDQMKAFRLPSMNAQGLADAYVEFLGTFFPENSKNSSAVTKKSLNPIFQGLPTLLCSVRNRERLKYRHLVLRVKSKENLTSSTIGYTILPLRWFLPEKGKLTRTKMFRHHLIKGGTYVGSAVIQGQITIAFTRDAHMLEAKDAKQQPSV